MANETRVCMRMSACTSYVRDASRKTHPHRRRASICIPDSEVLCRGRERGNIHVTPFKQTVRQSAHVSLTSNPLPRRRASMCFRHFAFLSPLRFAIVHWKNLVLLTRRTIWAIRLDGLVRGDPESPFLSREARRGGSWAQDWLNWCSYDVSNCSDSSIECKSMRPGPRNGRRRASRREYRSDQDMSLPSRGRVGGAASVPLKGLLETRPNKHVVGSELKNVCVWHKSLASQ